MALKNRRIQLFVVGIAGWTGICAISIFCFFEWDQLRLGILPSWWLFSAVMLGAAFYIYLARALSVSCPLPTSGHQSQFGGWGIAFGVLCLFGGLILGGRFENSQVTVEIDNALRASADYYNPGHQVSVSDLMLKGEETGHIVSAKTRNAFLRGYLAQRGNGVFVVDEVLGKSNDFKAHDKFAAIAETKEAWWGNSISGTGPGRLPNSESAKIEAKVHFSTSRAEEPLQIIGHLEMPCAWPWSSGTQESVSVSVVILPPSMQELGYEARSKWLFLLLQIPTIAFGTGIFVLILAFCLGINPDASNRM